MKGGAGGGLRCETSQKGKSGSKASPTSALDFHYEEDEMPMDEAAGFQSASRPKLTRKKSWSVKDGEEGEGVEVAVTSFVRDIGAGLLGRSFLGNSSQREKEDDRSTVSSLDGYSVTEPKHYQEAKRRARESVSPSTAPTSSSSNSSVEEEAVEAAPAGGP
eukprot:12780335-Ditylum_brightwellii.AAC.1